MQMAYGLAVMAAVALLPAGALAVEADQAMRRDAPRGVTEAFFSCITKADGDIVGLGQCITSEKKLQDSRLNTAYAALMGTLDRGGKEHLRAAELAWIEYNAKSVDTEMDVRGSEKTANIDASVNEVYRYAKRADTLEGLLSVMGGIK